MTKGFTCGECDYKVYMDKVTMLDKRVYLLGTCKRCGATVAVDMEKLFVLFYLPEQKGN